MRGFVEGMLVWLVSNQLFGGLRVLQEMLDEYEDFLGISRSIIWFGLGHMQDEVIDGCTDSCDEF